MSSTGDARFASDGSAPHEPRALLLALASAPEERRLDLLDAAGATTDLLVRMGDEAEQVATEDLPLTLAATAALVDAGDQRGDARARARARRARCRALAYGGQLERALETAREGIAIADAAGERVEAARGRLASLHPLCELGRVDEAADEAALARTALLEAGEPALAARADINLANLEKLRGAPDRALAHLDRARVALEGDVTMLAHIDNARGEALLFLDRFDESENAFRSSLDAFAGTAGFAEAIVRGNLADLCARQGRLQEALSQFEAARRRLERDGAAGHVARLLVEQAEALETAGLVEDALAAYEEAIPRLVDIGLTFEQARARLGRGRTLLRLNRLDDAPAELETAAALFDSLGDGLARARVAIIRGEHALRTGDRAGARRLFSGALSALDDHPSVGAAARFHLARLAVEEHQLDEAEMLLNVALRSAETLGIPTLLADMHHASGRLHRLQGDISAAIESYEHAIASVEQVRGTLNADRLRAAFLGERVSLYEDLVTALLERGGEDAVTRAFGVVEQAKSRALLDLIRGAVGGFARGLEQADDPEVRRMAREAARLQSELNALYSRLERSGEPDQRRFSSASVQARLRDNEQALARLEHRLSATEAGARALAPPVEVDAVRRALGDDTMLIEYFVADGELMAWLVDPREARLVRDLGDIAEVTDRVARLRFQVGRALRPGAMEGVRAARLVNDAHRELEVLHELVAAPVLEHLDEVSRLVVVPHGCLHLVPFHALRERSADGASQHVLDRYEVVVAPSAGVYVHAARRGGPDHVTGGTDHGGAAVIGVGDEAAPLIAEEARAIAKRLDADDLLLGSRATVERVVNAIRGRRVVHFACHGRFSSTAPLSSGLMMADRWMTVRDMIGLRLEADLVTLSGCETGCNLVAGGDELLGLLRGFLAAGAGSIVASLWTTSDRTTASLMERFYDALLDTSSGSGLEHAEPFAGGSFGSVRGRSPLRPAAALRRAQLALRDERPHPAFWAPFIVTGAS